MSDKGINVLKTSGEQHEFSARKLRASLLHCGASKNEVNDIVRRVEQELYDGISTREIYNRAFALLKGKKSIYASKYKLKKAIYELGPTGFPFERFIAALLYYSGYEVAVGEIMLGRCVSHEVDVLAKKNGQTIVAECKFHGDAKNKCDVKVPLYIASRYKDILEAPAKKNTVIPGQGWVVTNTRFTKDALAYGHCAGLYLLSWDIPKGDSLKERIDRLGLYPITVSTLLSGREIRFLLDRDIVLCRQLLKDIYYLDHLGVGENRRARIIDELKQLTTV